MPEADRLAKLIAHRREQERKNDKIRVHKNKVENDKLKVQVTYLDWSKALRGREFSNAEDDYVRKLEKIYDRQMFIQQQRIEEKEKKRKEKEAKKISSDAAQALLQVAEKDRRLAHGVKQEYAKSFMTKAKSLSGGYRDNDPPKVYYKRKGLVPPDRMVTPEMSAEAQANFGGGWRTPSSAEHLFVKKNLPKETPYGIDEFHPRPPPSRSQSVRSQSTRSGRSEPLMSFTSTSDDEEEETDLDRDLIDEVIRVNVRPSTAPNRRRISSFNKNKEQQNEQDEVLVTKQVPRLSMLSESQSIKLEPEIQTIELKESNEITVKHSRPATAAPSVRFAGNLPGTDRKNRSSLQLSRRSSIKQPAAMMFLKRGSIAGVGANGTRRASSAGAIRSRRKEQQPIKLTNAEQDRIRRKIEEKAECLHVERMKRLVVCCMKEKNEIIPLRIKSANTTREISFYEQYLGSTDARIRKTAWNNQLQQEKSSGEIETMLGFIDRCERGLALAEPAQAKSLLLQATHDASAKLQQNVHEFVRAS